MTDLEAELRDELSAMTAAGKMKRIPVLSSPQGPLVEMEGRGEVLVLSSNNYLGLAAHPDVVEAGIEGLRRYGAGTASVRFICGTFEPHLELERELAEQYNAMVMVDDSHATGFIGKTGRGTHEYNHVMGRVDVITSTLGTALGGASGGFTSGRKEIVALLRNRSRPYLFSNSLAPMIVSASLAVMKTLSSTTELRDRLEANTKRFRAGVSAAGFELRPGDTPIVPIMLGEARLAVELADKLLREGIYVIGFSYPVVPKGQARIRVQLSAAHSPEHIDRAIAAFTKVGKELGVIG
jgi:7-keto-8-aminopelargonate synthetase-like enzyme